MIRSFAFHTAAMILALLAAGVCVNASPQDTQPPSCDAAVLQGRYAINFTGAIVGVDPSVTPTWWRAEIGILTFDGAGNFTGTDTYNLGGSVYRDKLSGTYTVNADCTGSITGSVSNPGTTSIAAWQNGDMVILLGGREVNFVQTDVVTGNNPYPQVLSGVMKLRNPIPASPLRGRPL